MRYLNFWYWSKNEIDMFVSTFYNRLILNYYKSSQMHTVYKPNIQIKYLNP